MYVDNFAEGLSSLLAGDDTPQAEATLNIISETVILHRLWLKSHEEKK